jgi:hypothetical protein
MARNPLNNEARRAGLAPLENGTPSSHRGPHNARPAKRRKVPPIAGSMTRRGVPPERLLKGSADRRVSEVAIVADWHFGDAVTRVNRRSR